MNASVAVMGMGGPDDLPRCLDALAAQRGPKLEIVVTSDPAIDYGRLVDRYPHVKFVENVGQKSPLELAARAIENTSSDRVLVTKDYCVPDPNWAVTLLDALDGPCAAAGGAVDVATEDPVEWAYSFIDLYRFASPLPAGETQTLTVHNAAYRRADLESLDYDWRAGFQESEVHEALAKRGPLLAVPGARVVIDRRIGLNHGVAERYRLGRIYAAKRIDGTSAGTRVALGAGMPVLPALMLSRIAMRSATTSSLRKQLVRSIVPMSMMLVARAGGEWMGYVTGRSS